MAAARHHPRASYHDATLATPTVCARGVATTDVPTLTGPIVGVAVRLSRYPCYYMYHVHVASEVVPRISAMHKVMILIMMSHELI